MNAKSRPAAWLAATLILGAASPTARAATPEQNAVISASTDFSIAYSVWLWEKRCQSNPKLKSDFDAVIKDDLARLSAAVDLKLFNAITGSAQDTANGDKVPACGSSDAKDFVAFGLDLANKAHTTLTSLPAGYHLTISD